MDCPSSSHYHTKVPTPSLPSVLWDLAALKFLQGRWSLSEWPGLGCPLTPAINSMHTPLWVAMASSPPRRNPAVLRWPAHFINTHWIQSHHIQWSYPSNHDAWNEKLNTHIRFCNKKDRISNSFATERPDRQVRGHFLSLRPSGTAPAGTFPEEMSLLGPGTRTHHLTWSSVQAREAEITFSSHGWRHWSSHEFTSLFSFASLMSGKARTRARDYPVPEPDLPLAVMSPVVLDSATESGNWKVIKPQILGVQRNQRFGRKGPCGHDEMNLSPHTFEETRVSCSVIALLWSSVEPSSVFLLLICKQDSFLPPTRIAGGADEVYNVCNSLWAHQRQRCINTILLYTFP